MKQYKAGTYRLTAERHGHSSTPQVWQLMQ